jgi:hypothetical protein
MNSPLNSRSVFTHYRVSVGEDEIQDNNIYISMSYEALYVGSEC